MRHEQDGSEDTRRPNFDDESRHEKHRRIKSEQERMLRKQLCHLRSEEADEIEAEPLRPRRFKD